MHRFAAEFGQESATVSFDDMVTDLRAIYSGPGSTITADDLITDIQALYPASEMPISLDDLKADMRELYGDQPVAWSDFVVDFESLYEVHQLIAA